MSHVQTLKDLDEIYSTRIYPFCKQVLFSEQMLLSLAVPLIKGHIKLHVGHVIEVFKLHNWRIKMVATLLNSSVKVSFIERINNDTKSVVLIVKHN